VEFNVEEGARLALASREDVAVAENKVVLPPDSLVVLSREQN